MGNKFVILEERLGIQERLKEVKFGHKNDQRPHTKLEIVRDASNGTKMRQQGNNDLQVEGKLPSNSSTMAWSP